MGAWDDGLLDNDSSQDFIGAFALGVEQDIIAIHENRSRKLAGNLSAAVGILLRLSHRFDPIPGLGEPPHFYPRLICALSANCEYFLSFPGDTPTLLAMILAGRGSELSERPAKLNKQIQKCLFGGKPGVLQGGFSKLEMDLFSHSSAKAYLASKSKYLIREIDSQLKDRKEVIDMSYSYLGGMIGLLLVLPIKGLTSKKIEIWQKRCHAIWNSDGSDGETNDIEFERGFRKKVDRAFGCAVKIYS